jgi:cytochrome P450
MSAIRRSGGRRLLLILAAANRDPEAFRNPISSCSTDQSTKRCARHGIQYCLGCPLARLEGRIALQTVFERCPAIRQAGDLRYANNFNVRLLHSLPVATS